jgi:hypothetical protein
MHAMLKRVEYLEPCLSLGLINQPAFELALQKDRERRKKFDTEQSARSANPNLTPSRSSS